MEDIVDKSIAPSVFHSLILIGASVLSVSCSATNFAIKPNAKLADIVVNISESDTLKTSGLVNYFGDYQKTQRSGYGAVLRWGKKLTVDNFIIDEITASNWHQDSLDILRNINFILNTSNCYHYKIASVDFSLNGKQIMPPNPHSTSGAEVIHFSIKKHSWGAANYYFDKNQCLNVIRLTSNAHSID